MPTGRAPRTLALSLCNLLLFSFASALATGSYAGEAEQIAYDYALSHTAANVPVALDKTPSTLEDGTYISAVPSEGEISPYALNDDIVIGRYVENSQLFF